MQNKCTGCSACYSICPVDAIKMQVNENGFYMPIVNNNMCIKCGLCDNVCMISKGKLMLTELGSFGLYSAYSEDKNTRSTSSSGGIAFEILKQNIKKSNLKVCGVIYDYKYNIARHIVLDETYINEIENLKGSKYLQSQNAEAFKSILKFDKGIIFGTPCQIAGIDMVLRKKRKRNNFLLIDIFCHGVPSQNLWIKYIEYLSDKYNISQIKSVQFRNKKLGWHKYFIDIESTDDRYVKFSGFDPYLKLFLHNACNLEACYGCKFRNKSSSDIRLGDYWGERYQKDEQGYSMVLLNTVKGHESFKELQGISHTRYDLNERLSQQTESINIPPKRIKILEELKDEKINIRKIYRYYPNYYVLKGKNFIKRLVPLKIKSKIKDLKY